MSPPRAALRSSALAALALSISACLQNGEDLSAPSTPSALSGLHATALAELRVPNGALGSQTLCVRLIDDSVQCGPLDNDIPFTRIPGLETTQSLFVFDQAPVGTEADAGAAMVCGSSATGTTCAALSAGQHGEISGAVVPTPLSQATGLRTTAGGLAICGEWTGVGNACVWNAQQMNSESASAPADWHISWPPACLVLQDGSVSCWAAPVLDGGEPAFVFAALNPDAGAPTPGLSAVAQLEVTDESSCARTRDGAVTCWGQLGDRNGNALQVMDSNGNGPLSGATSISVTRDQGCALLKDQTVACWGSTAFAPPPPAADDLSPGVEKADNAYSAPHVSGATALVAGESVEESPKVNLDCAIVADGAVLCFGGFTPHGSGIPEGI
jgi:hypothetical protein